MKITEGRVSIQQHTRGWDVQRESDGTVIAQNCTQGDALFIAFAYNRLAKLRASDAGSANKEGGTL